eukprot:gene1844-2077_t
MTNPFDPDLKDLVNITSGEVAKPSVVKDMLAAKELGEAKFKEFVDDKVTPDQPDLFSTMTRTNLNTFTKKKVSCKISTRNGKVVELKNDSKFISRLLAIGESREIDMKNLMSYSLRKYPSPFATYDGDLVKSPKSKLLNELLSRVDDPTVETTQMPGALMLDAMAMLQTMKRIPETFGEFAEIIVELILNCAKASHAARVDFVCDRYPTISIKSLERSKRAESGVTQIRIGGPNQKVPRQFRKFLGLGENKESLIEFIFKHLCTMQLQDKLHNISLYFSHGQRCHRFCVDEENMTKIEEVVELNSNQEEADTRLLLHAKNASITHPTVTVRSPDTDVFILMLGHKSMIDASLYFDTGSGNQRRLLDIDKIHGQLGAELCEALVGFHAFTGCDSTSAFFSKGKIKNLKVLDDNPVFVNTFKRVGSAFTASSLLVKEIEKFVCLLYGQKQVDDVDLARYNLFRLGKYCSSDMPCTKDSLKKHIGRAMYQAAIWRRCLSPVVNCPDISEHGWLLDDAGGVSIDWMDLPPAPDGILENVQCSCKKGCSTNRCSCQKANLQCTSLCRCSSCSNIVVSQDGVTESDTESDNMDPSDTDDSDINDD